MRKLALNDEILLKVENPARYIGNEVNSVMKDKNVDVRFCMAFQMQCVMPQMLPNSIRIFLN